VILKGKMHWGDNRTGNKIIDHSLWRLNTQPKPLCSVREKLLLLPPGYSRKMNPQVEGFFPRREETQSQEATKLKETQQ
jgi:hypothetical protein